MVENIDQDSKSIELIDIENRHDLAKQNTQHPKLSIGRILREICIECITETSFMGIPNVVKDNLHKVIRVLWLLAFLAFLATCIWNIVISIESYISWPTYWTIDNIQEIPTKFPAVTICNKKLLDTSKPATQAWMAANLQNLPGPNFYAFNNYYEWNWFTNYYTRVSMTTDATLNSTTKKALGFQIEDMLFSCDFNVQGCNTSAFTYYFDTKYGNCYTWNKATPALETALAEINGGLTLELYLGNPAKDTIYNYEDGIFMSIHNQSDIPFSKNPIIKVPAGSSTTFIFKKNIIQKQQPPYGTCMQDGFSSDLYFYIVNTLGANYSQSYCFNLCFQQLFISTCNCYNIDYPLTSLNMTVQPCSIYTDATCSRSVFTILPSAATVASCKAKCPYECYQVEYELNSYQARYPTDFYIPYLYNKTISKGLSVNYTDIYKAFVKIDISFDSMVYKSSIETQKYAVMDLIGMLGGAMSFWIGGGLLSFVELIQLGFDMTKALVNYYTLKKQISKNIKPNSFF